MILTYKRLFVLCYGFHIFTNTNLAQSLNTLTSFRTPSANWQMVGEVLGTPSDKTLTSKVGTGILLCTPKNGLYKEADNLISHLEHGDVDLSFDVMIPKGANSGVYLQGRYEIQVFDSWGVTHPTYTDAGSIYQRWDETRGKNTEGYEGHAPRLNAVKAPGLWNHVEISFIAPRFDAAGKKTANARFAKVTWNGLVIHQNVELFGPTRAAVFSDEKPLGPIMFQGDHGVVAFKNIAITKLGNSTISLSAPVKYQIYENALISEKYGAVQEKPKVKDLTTIKPVLTGETNLIDATVSRRGIQYYVFTGKFKVAKTDMYDIKGNWHGYANVWIDDELVFSDENTPWYGLGFNEESFGKKQLTQGEHSFKIGYTHREWEKQMRAVAFYLKNANNTEGWQALHEKSSEIEFSKTVLNVIEPTTQPIFQRSFVDFNGKKRTHAINVGFPQGLHYSYDTKQGGLLHVWRGRFLNTTEMWHERGEEQTAEPLGVSVQLTGRFSLINKDKLDSIPESELRYEGINLMNIEGQKTPQFSYRYQSTTIKDWTQPSANKQGLQRTITLSTPLPNMNVLVSTTTKGIQKTAEGLFAVNGAEYFIKLPSGLSAVITEKNGQQMLMVALNTAVFSYEIIF
jgi:hypothetical protein